MGEPEIIALSAEHAPEIARLHITGITGGFISSLGMNFVTALYETIACSDSSFGYVVRHGDKIVGFMSFTTDLNKLYKSVIRKSGIKFLMQLVGKSFSLPVMKKIFETLFYPQRMKKLELPAAELLSIVIAEENRGHGLATRLLRTGFDECIKRDIKKIKILVGPQIGLYDKLGFKVFTQIVNHGVVSNVYVVPTDHFQKRDAE